MRRMQTLAPKGAQRKKSVMIKDDVDLTAPAKRKKTDSLLIELPGLGDRKNNKNKGNSLMRQQTVAQKRKSVMVPRLLKEADQLDLSDNANEYNSDDDNSYSMSPDKRRNKDRYNLLNYNSERKDKLNEFDYTQDEIKLEEETDLDKKVADANNLRTHPCTGNLEISLFWEEKIAIIFRFAQLYGIIFFFYYEMWPANTRLWMTGMFCGFNFSFYILNQDQMYEFMQDLPRILYVLSGALGVTFIFYTISASTLSMKKLRYRIENKNNKKPSACNFYRVWFWVMEIMMLPLLINISWPSACNFWSERDAIELTDCKDYGMATYYVMKVLKGFSFFCALGYNVYLFWILQTNKINYKYHEEAVQKKEVEFVHNINNIWINQQFYTFSSFRSGLANMYHRIINNLYAIAMVATFVFADID